MPPKAALHRLDGKRDLFELHGLDQIPVGACGDGVLEGVRTETARHDQHTGIGAPKQELDEIDAVGARQHEVDRVEIVIEGFRIGAPVVAVLVDEDLGAQLPEPLSEKRRVLLVIVDQGQDFRIHGIAPGRFWFDVTDRPRLKWRYAIGRRVLSVCLSVCLVGAAA